MAPRTFRSTLGSLLGPIFRRNTRVKPTETRGAQGVRVYGGYVSTQEKHPTLSTPAQRYRTYSDILANTSVVAAGVRYFLNLLGGAKWTLVPAEENDTAAEEYAELATQMILEDPVTPFHRIVRRMGMYRFWGFSIQEWTAIKREDGRMTLQDVAPRAQRTIEKWDMDESGHVAGVIQRIPQTQRRRLPAPREDRLCGR